MQCHTLMTAQSPCSMASLLASTLIIAIIARLIVVFAHRTCASVSQGHQDSITAEIRTAEREAVGRADASQLQQHGVHSGWL